MKELLHITHEKPIVKSKRISIEFTNPKNINILKPFIYYIEITSNKNIKYTYIGKASSKSRPNAYNRSIKRIFEGKPKRPAIKRNGEKQSEGNKKYRYVHLVLATAVKNKWKMYFYPIENCEESELNRIEKKRIIEYKCNMNEGASWYVEEFERKSALIK